jgi:hypothetical protein
VTSWLMPHRAVEPKGPRQIHRPGAMPAAVSSVWGRKWREEVLFGGHNRMQRPPGGLRAWSARRVHEVAR